MADKRKVEELRVIFHGYKHSQYFEGHGVSFSRFAYCATGIGESHSEALDDAIEQLCDSDYDVASTDFDALLREYVLAETGKTLEQLEEQQDSDHSLMHNECEGDDDNCELHYFVSIDVR